MTSIISKYFLRYVLQLAIADLLFLLTLPFKISEDFLGGWTYSEWMCKAIETILFLNYYASCLFLMVSVKKEIENILLYISFD